MACHGEGDLLNLGDMVDVDDVALVHADELVARQLVLERLETVERGDALVLGVERYILVLPFDVVDVVEVDLVELVVGLHHQVWGLRRSLRRGLRSLKGLRGSLKGCFLRGARAELGVRGLRGLRGLRGGCQTLDAGDGLLDGLHEAGEGDGLEQVIDGRDLVAFEGIFAVGGGEDDGGHVLEGARQLDAVEVGHVNVEEDDIDMMLLAEAECLEGVLGGACELEFGNLADVVLQEFAGEEFVVDYQYIIHRG